jgi:hypothetical protein|tara:strand:+ start:1187 stop:1774 length:588 start_codon:yes stop_codon:yes gene_type:complete
MIDPITALSLASAAFTGVKKAVQLGKDVEDIYGALSKWAGHISDVTEHMNQNEPKKPGLFEKIGFSKSETQEAFDHLIAKKKIKDMEDQIRHMFTWGELHHLGLDGYRDFIKRRREIKAQREKQIYEQMRRRKAFFTLIKNICIGAVLIIFSIWIMWFMIDLIANAPGMKGKEDGKSQINNTREEITTRISIRKI